MFKPGKNEIHHRIDERPLSPSTKKIIQNLETPPTKTRLISDFLNIILYLSLIVSWGHGIYLATDWLHKFFALFPVYAWYLSFSNIMQYLGII